MANGWAYWGQKRLFYNEQTGAGWDVSELCKGSARVQGERLRADPPRYVLHCYDREWKATRGRMIWSPPNRVEAVSLELDALMSERGATYIDEAATYALLPADKGSIYPEGHMGSFNTDGQRFEVIAPGYGDQCSLATYGGGGIRYAWGCRRPGRSPRHFDLVDETRRVRGRFNASFVAGSRDGRIAAVVRRGGHDVVVLVELPTTPHREH